MTDKLRTIVLPASAMASRVLDGPAMDPATIRTLTFDASGLGMVTEAAAVADAPLEVGETTVIGGRQVTVTVSGGAPNTVARMGLAVKLDTGDRENFVIQISIRPLLPAVSFSPGLVDSHGGALLDSQYGRLIEG